MPAYIKLNTALYKFLAFQFLSHISVISAVISNNTSCPFNLEKTRVHFKCGDFCKVHKICHSKLCFSGNLLTALVSRNCRYLPYNTVTNEEGLRLQ